MLCSYSLCLEKNLLSYSKVQRSMLFFLTVTYRKTNFELQCVWTKINVHLVLTELPPAEISLSVSPLNADLLEGFTIALMLLYCSNAVE